jgi:hypothetical protein
MNVTYLFTAFSYISSKNMFAQLNDVGRSFKTVYQFAAQRISAAHPAPGGVPKLQPGPAPPVAASPDGNSKPNGRQVILYRSNSV